jgi:ribosome-binding factor A
MRKKSSAKPPSQRQQRVSEEIRAILSEILLRGDFSRRDLPLVPVTLTHVHVSPDLRNAKVYVMPLGGSDLKDTVASLNDMAGELRFALAKKLITKYMPILKFYQDDTFEQARRIEQLLETAHKRGTGQD